MYSIIRIQIGKKHPLYGYFSDMTHAANNISNAVLFRMRQVMTAVNKDEHDWTDNERSVMDEVRQFVDKSNGKFSMPTKKKWVLSDGFLKGLMVFTENPDYYDPRISKQTAQQMISGRVRDMRSFFAASRDYHENPGKYKAAPKLPKYKKSGGMSTVYLTNQDCYLFPDKDGKLQLKLPLTKKTVTVGTHAAGTLKQVTVIPNHEIFTVALCMEEDGNLPDVGNIIHRRICNIDVGVNNLAAITNNIGMPSLLFKGGIIKSTNQWYNKQLAKIMSQQTKGSDARFHMTPEAHALLVTRDNQIDDFLHKCAKRVVTWCIKNDIDTIIYGRNIDWKQNCDMGRQSNQNFVQIPFDKFRRILKYLAERAGICFLEQEESYTSKADFAAFDPIPVYGKNDKPKPKFSGNRIKRGLYKNSRGEIINADLNGSANIGRKCIPDMFDSGLYPEFHQSIVRKHPDEDNIRANREKQLSENHGPSKRKLKRLRRKGKLTA